jgi:hypothetical protein
VLALELSVADRGLDGLGKSRQHVKNITDDAVVRDLEDGCFRVLLTATM